MLIRRINQLAGRCLLYLNRVEDGLLVMMLSVMVILAIAQIFYRNIFDAGIVWIDPLLRVLVLWVAIMGAVVATRTNNHIRIDYFTRHFSHHINVFILRLVFAFSFVICTLVAWHSVRFVQMDYEFATIAFSDVPVWVTSLIIPVGFALMAFRFLMLFISPQDQEQR